jgi:hypothetical protein
MRTTYCAVAAGARPAARAKTALRNRAKATPEQEAAALGMVLHDAHLGGVVIIPPMKQLIEKELGKTMTGSSSQTKTVLRVTEKRRAASDLPPLVRVA